MNIGKWEKRSKKVILILFIITQCLLVSVILCCQTLWDIGDMERKYLLGLCVLELLFSFLIILERKYQVLGQFIWILEVICFSALCVGQLEIALGILYDFKDIVAGVWNVLLVLFAVLFLSLFFRRIKWSMITLNILVFLLGMANHYYFQFREKPLLLSDILLSETAMTVIGNYEYKIDRVLLCFLLIQIAIFFSCLLKGKEKHGRREQSVLVVGCFLILLGKDGYAPTIYGWNINDTVQLSGYLNTVLEKAYIDRKYEEPENYSPEFVGEILEKYQVETSLEEPINVIVIMNEAFADLPDVYGFETDVDGMPFIHSLEKNTVKGNMYVSVFGGATANTEYEFLTGNTMAFFNEGCVPYVQFVKKISPSLASHLKKFGYQTIAFHPNAPTNYDRSSVYSFFGFDEFVSSESELTYAEYLRWAMSDDSDYRNVIDMYENKQEKTPLFLFNVTIQNHGGYNTSESSVEVSVKPKDVALQFPEMLEYLSLIKASDEAFEMLITYFSNIDEKTVILMFGDHQPAFWNETLQKNLNEYAEKNNSFIKGNKYIVPFVLWANYDIPEEKNLLISPGYLRGKLLDTAGIPLSNYDGFLAEGREKYSAISFYGGFDNMGNTVGWENLLQNEWIKKYQILQYANVFGGKEVNGKF